VTVKAGVAHAAGLYPVSASFVTDGMTAIKNLGSKSKTIKLFFSSDYATKYPNQTGWGTVANMVDLASSTPMATVLGDSQLTDYAINVFPWWAGFEAESLTNYWINGVTTGGVSPSTYLANEKTAVQNLATHLLTTYAGTGKTFILNNWEGDWQLLNSFVYTDVPKAYWADRMRQVLRARMDGVKAARAASSATGVTVKFSIEVNRALDPGRRIHREIFPLLQPDAVSWSAWEVMTDASVYTGTIAGACAVLDSGMRRFHAEIRKYTDAPIMIGEYGWPEAEINTTTYPVGQLIQQVLDTADALGWTHAIYWQIYDNEAGPRGFYIKKPDGSYSLAGTKHQSIFA